MTWLLLLALTACDRAPPTTDDTSPPATDTSVDTDVDTAPPEDPGPLLILVSMDGFRHDYLARAYTPTLDRIAAEGVRADALVPVFPANTFPNHYTQVTGLYPAHHGLIDNAFWAPDLGASFRMSEASHQTDPKWWGGEPIWITAEKQGFRAATMYWVGSEVRWDHGVSQTWMMPFQVYLSFDERVEGVLDWLDAPRPPNLVTLYFNQPDGAGHQHGPDAEAAALMAGTVDRTLGRLVAGLEARGRYDDAHLIFVSDHGMTPLHADDRVYLDDHLDLERVWVHRWGAWASLWPKDPDETASLAASLADVPNATCAQPADLPAHLHFGEGARVPPIVCVADNGWEITRRDYTGGGYAAGHGFDPAHPDMHGIFLARGPRLKEGVVVPAFESVHVHALLTTLLDLDPPEVDARRDEIEGLLRDE